MKIDKRLMVVVSIGVIFSLVCVTGDVYINDKGNFTANETLNFTFYNGSVRIDGGLLYNTNGSNLWMYDESASNYNTTVFFFNSYESALTKGDLLYMRKLTNTSGYKEGYLRLHPQNGNLGWLSLKTYDPVQGATYGLEPFAWLGTWKYPLYLKVRSYSAADDMTAEGLHTNKSVFTNADFYVGGNIYLRDNSDKDNKTLETILNDSGLFSNTQNFTFNSDVTFAADVYGLNYSNLSEGGDTHIHHWDNISNEPFPINCSDNEIMKWSVSNNNWSCAIDDSGGGGDNTTAWFVSNDAIVQYNDSYVLSMQSVGRDKNITISHDDTYGLIESSDAINIQSNGINSRYLRIESNDSNVIIKAMGDYRTVFTSDNNGGAFIDIMHTADGGGDSGIMIRKDGKYNDFVKLFFNNLRSGLVFDGSSGYDNFGPNGNKVEDFGSSSYSWDNCYCDDFINKPRDLVSLTENNLYNFRIDTLTMQGDLIERVIPDIDQNKYKTYSTYLDILKDIPYYENTGTTDFYDIPLILRDKELNNDTLSTYAMLMALRNSNLELEDTIKKLEVRIIELELRGVGWI